MLWTPSRRNAGRIDCFDLFSIFAIPKATLAQSVEQRIRNAQVASSSLVSGSKRQPSGCLFSLYTGSAVPDRYAAGQSRLGHSRAKTSQPSRSGALQRRFEASRAYFPTLSFSIFRLRSRVQLGRSRRRGRLPRNILEASVSPLSCQSSQARATTVNSPP